MKAIVLTPRQIRANDTKMMLNGLWAGLGASLVILTAVILN